MEILKIYNKNINKFIYLLNINDFSMIGNKKAIEKYLKCSLIPENIKEV